MSSNFESLANLPGHIASFAASADDGKIVNDTTGGELADEAKAAVQMVHDATELARSIPALQKEKLRSVTVTCQNKYHSYTTTNGVVYGVQRETDA